MKIIKPSVGILNATRFPEATIEDAARHSTRTRGTKKGDDFIRYLIERGHLTPLRFATAAFSVTADRGVIDELRTHQHADFVVESTRYCGYDKERFGGELEFIEPPFLNVNDRVNWYDICSSAEKQYMKMRERGCKPELARSVLPLSIASRCAIHANFQEWRHIIKMRLAKDAHPQIREIMAMILTEFRQRWPVIVEDIEVSQC